MKTFTTLLLFSLPILMFSQTTTENELKKEIESNKVIINNLEKDLNKKKAELKNLEQQCISEINRIVKEYSNSLNQYKSEPKSEIQLNNFLNNKVSNNEVVEIEALKEFDFLNGKLPESFYNRSFWNGLSTSTYNLFNLPGQIIRKKGENEYEFITVIPLILENENIENEIINEGLLFKDFLTNEKKINGSYIIGGFEALKNEIVEVSLIDLLKTSPPKKAIDIEKLKKYQAKILKMTNSEDYYFINSALLTIGTGRKFKESKFKKQVNSIYLTVEGNIYKSKEQIKKERIISVELTSIKDMILE